MGSILRVEATYTLDADLHIPFHSPEPLLFLVKGAVSSLSDGKYQAAIQGCAIGYVPADVSVTLSLSGRGGSCLVLQVVTAGLRALLSDTLPSALYEPSLPGCIFPADDRLCSLFMLLWDDAKTAPSTNYTAHLLFALSSRFSSMACTESVGTVGKVHQEILIEKVKSYVAQNLSEKLSLDDIAHLLFVNPSYLCTLFKRMAGMTFRQYVNQARIAKAKKLLLESNELVDDIAQMVGYSATAYFITVFRAQCGTTPNAFRKQVNRSRNTRELT